MYILVYIYKGSSDSLWLCYAVVTVSRLHRCCNGLSVLTPNALDRSPTPGRVKRKTIKLIFAASLNTQHLKSKSKN
jgi:hypothetical protein